MKLFALFALLSLWGISNSIRYVLQGREGEWCEETLDCRERLHCVNGKCRLSLGLIGWPCDERFDCFQKYGLACVNERCAPSHSYGEKCKFNHHCKIELVCHKRICRTPEEAEGIDPSQQNITMRNSDDQNDYQLPSLPSQSPNSVPILGSTD